MTKHTVSRTQAEAILSDIKQSFPSYVEWTSGPNLRDNDHEELAEGSWSIDWEEGPYEWTFHYSQLVSFPGVLVEPINGCILGIHPA